MAVAINSGYYSMVILPSLGVQSYLLLSSATLKIHLLLDDLYSVSFLVLWVQKVEVLLQEEEEEILVIQFRIGFAMW